MSVVRQLLAAGLVDELHLFVHPIAVGKGLRLFEDGGPTLPLKLISSQTFETRRGPPRLRTGHGPSGRVV